MKKLVIFKSTPENYTKEYDGRKSNTVRKSDGGSRFKMLDSFTNPLESEMYIEIINTKFPDKQFVRRISDVTVFEGFYIISWINPCECD